MIDAALNALEKQNNVQAADWWEGKIRLRITGQMTHAKLCELFQRRYRQEFLDNLREFTLGTLFPSQKMPFDVWRDLPGFKKKREQEQADEMLFKEDAAGYRKEGEQSDLEIFCMLRIYAGRSFWKGFKKQEEAIELWHGQNKKYGWEWR